jgi:PAS domain S-box-containing protein
VSLCFTTIITFAAVPSVVSNQNHQQTKVLFLSFLDPDLPDVAALIEEAETRILENRDTPVHFTLEYLDPDTIDADSLRQNKTVALLREKHRDQSFDLVIAIGAQPSGFERLSRTKLLPAAPIVFFVVDPDETIGPLKLPPKSTAVVQKLNYLSTLQMALRQNPSTRRVIVVSGSSAAEKRQIGTAREQYRSYESSVDFQYWTNLTFPDLRSRLMTVERDSVVILLNFMKDGAGEGFTPARVLRTVAATSSRPLYGTYLSFVGNGVVGGHVADLHEVGRTLGSQGARILNGEKPENIAAENGEFQRDVFDRRQLRRWRISEERLPEGSTVLYWEYSVWELYRWRILGLIGLIVIQTLLIVLLIRSRASRKSAEQQLKKSEEMFSKAFRQGPMALTLTSADTHEYIDVNETFERLTGYGRDELIGRNALEVGMWTKPDETARFAKGLSAEGHFLDAEIQFRAKDGQCRIVQGSAELIEIGGQQCILGAAIDITDRKHAEQALEESEKRFRLMADSTPVLMWLSGPDKLCTDFNREWLRFTGRTIEEELGEGWSQNVHPDDLQVCLHTYTCAFDARQKFSIEYRLRRNDGDYRWMLSQGVPRFLEDGGFAGYIGCCVDITDQKKAKAVLAELSGRLIQAQEEERARIARELHDDINQRLALLANGLQEAVMTRGIRKSQQGELRQLWQLTNDIATDIQHLSHRLHPSKLHYLGLPAAARELCREFSKQQKIDVECIVHDMPTDLDETVSLCLFRTIQEALRNIGKHSQAHHVKVELTGESMLVRLRVADDGVGFNPDHPSDARGIGLVSMRERLKSVGGDVSILSRPSSGTVVEGTVPVIRIRAQSA